jgi:heme/copper-type cytochrome/quinol oxidase subunit 2
MNWLHTLITRVRLTKVRRRTSFAAWLPAVLGIVILIFPFPAHHGQPVERSIRIEASRFAYSPSIIKVNQGDRVTLELTSNDVVHGLAVDGYGQQVTADPGQTARLTFTAERTGSFRFRCTVTCGPMHPFMIGKIQVGQNSLWWRAVGLSLLAIVSVLWRRLA